MNTPLPYRTALCLHSVTPARLAVVGCLVSMVVAWVVLLATEVTHADTHLGTIPQVPWSPRVIKQATTGASPRNIEVVDMNNDGRLDIVTCYPLPIWLENPPDGIESWTEHAIENSFGRLGCFEIGVADFNQDGWVDLIAEGRSDRDFVAWYENTGEPESAWIEHIIYDEDAVPPIGAGGGDINQFHIHDFNSDGRLDALTEVGWYENIDAIPTEFRFRAYSGGAGGRVISVTDIDGDGDLDFYGVNCNANELIWVENADSRGYFLISHTVSNRMYNCPLYLPMRDLDGDGDQDILAELGCNILWFERLNTEKPQWREATLLEGVQYEHCPIRTTAEHIDDDALLDLVYYNPPTESFSWIPGNRLGEPTLFPSIELVSSPDLYTIVSFADLDGDGLNDVIGRTAKSYRDTTITWFRNPIPDCGNGILEEGELCDDGGDSELCDDDCSFPECGDGNVNVLTGEECDDANLNPTDSCTDSCEVARCGDGNVHAGVEECDDANDDEHDQCTRDCERREQCGDANSDRELTAADALVVIQRAVGLSVVCPDWICDTDNNGDITASNALAVLRKAVGLETELVCGFPTRVVLRLAESRERRISALQFHVDYSSFDGQFDGNGETVNCTNQLNDATALFNNKDEEKALHAAYVKIEGITGYRTLATCDIITDRPVDRNDFRVTVTDAVNTNDRLHAPFPEVTAVPY